MTKRISIKRYWFLSFAKNMGTNLGKNISKRLNSKYSQKRPDHAIHSATDAFKTFSKKIIQKTAEATRDLFGNKIADKIRRSSKTSPEDNLGTNEEILREKYISP